MLTIIFLDNRIRQQIYLLIRRRQSLRDTMTLSRGGEALTLHLGLIENCILFETTTRKDGGKYLYKCLEKSNRTKLKMRGPTLPLIRTGPSATRAPKRCKVVSLSHTCTIFVDSLRKLPLQAARLSLRPQILQAFFL